MNPFDAEARTLYDRDIDAGRRNSLAVLLDLVPAGADVLDVGIGGGAHGRHLASAVGCRVRVTSFVAPVWPPNPGRDSRNLSRAGGVRFPQTDAACFRWSTAWRAA